MAAAEALAIPRRGTKPRGGAGTKGVPRADREQQMLDAAAEEFSLHGYAHASMVDVARRAGISKPLVYDYFGSKEGLYLACLDRAGTRLVDGIAAVQQGTSLKRAVDTLGAIFAALDGRPFDWAVVFDGTLPQGSEVHDAARAYRRRLAELGAQGTSEVLQGSGITDPGDQSLLSTVWASAVSAIVEWWLAHPDESAAAMAERCARMLETFGRPQR